MNIFSYQERRGIPPQEFPLHSHDLELKRAEGFHLTDEEVNKLQDLYKVFSDSLRLKILLLLQSGEFCVNSISRILSIPQSNISHSLAILKRANLVACRKEGKTSVYFLKDDHVYKIISQGYEHISEKQ